MAKPRKTAAVKKAGSSPKKARIRKHSKKAAASTASGKGTDDIFGFMAGKITITGDIVAPAFSPEEWGDLYPSPRPRRPRRQKP
jgi:hypothetical protein